MIIGGGMVSLPIGKKRKGSNVLIMKRIKFWLKSVRESAKPYLRVEPAEPQWIDVNNPIDYDVFSNTDWLLHLSNQP